MAALEENIFTMERGTRAEGKPVGFRRFSRRDARASRKPEARRIPTPVIRPISVGMIFTTVFKPSKALGEDDKKMLMARALQMFMPGKPQVWYLDLFAGKNDHEAVKRAGAGGHKEINRTNLSAAQIEELMKTDIVKEQLKLLHFRNVSKAFGFDAELAVSTEGEIITFIWTNQGESATLRANLKTFEYEITDSEGIYA